ncbi:MAG: hypothetical protein AAFR61_13500 [Bacteroidota bacterium]
MGNFFLYLAGLFGATTERPRVILDFVLQDGNMYLQLHNQGAEAAYDLRTSFSQPVKAVNGSRIASNLPVFTENPSLPPLKYHRIFLDPLPVFLHHLEEEHLRVELVYKDHKGNSCRAQWAFHFDLFQHLPQGSEADFLLNS